MLVTKGERGKSGATVMAIGALAGVGPWKSPEDSRQLHFVDTLRAGCLLNEQKLTRIMVDEAPRRIAELEQRGAYFARAGKSNRYLLRTEGGHSQPRGIFIESRIGLEILKTLYGELARLKTRTVDNLMVIHLQMDNESWGALGLNIVNGEWVWLKSKAVVLATGGPGQLYSYNTQNLNNTGDGLALAVNAGATLIDMEFTQFYPWGFLSHGSRRGLLAGVSYFSRLYNRHKERFMEKYDPIRLEMSTRDIVARAIYQEIREGRGTGRGGVYCDMTHNPASAVRNTLPTIYNYFLHSGIDLEQKIFEVIPTFHYHMGGVQVDEYWQTCCPGLWAVGEVAGGVHGANRLSQNSLADILVSGARAGKRAAEYSLQTKRVRYNPLIIKEVVKKHEKLLSHTPRGHLRPKQIKRKIQKTMWENVGIIRNKRHLERAHEEMERIRKKETPLMALSSSDRICNHELVEVFEAHHLEQIAECIILAALARKESRGAHYREDFPIPDNRNMLKHMTLRKDTREFLLGTCPVDLSIMSARNFIQ